MDNNLKLLMTEGDLHNLKTASINLQKYITEVLAPLKDTFANEARRAINYNRRIDTAIHEGEKIIAQIKAIIG